MEYRNKNPSVLSLAIVCLEKVENRTIYLKGTFKMDLTKITNCRLYKRYFDFNLNKVLTTFAEIDERNDDNKSVSMVSVFLYEVICKDFLQILGALDVHLLS